MSLIIVGVGDADFGSMEELDGDDGPLCGGPGMQYVGACSPAMSSSFWLKEQRDSVCICRGPRAEFCDDRDSACPVSV